mmetsp:Transcript_6815/g.18885  ORF Transcript_6815/g.18885 Transcript_6815/m.18885 type:complete len:349 (-) Transcript_6815:68-1114(-)
MEQFLAGVSGPAHVPEAGPAGVPPASAIHRGPMGEDRSHEKIPQTRNSKSLEQMMSLKPGDDERTEISKKVSWILRHGARKVGVEIDSEGWVLLANLVRSDILRGVAGEKLFEIIMESNEQKVRYEVKDTECGKAIRAVAKHTIGGMSGGWRPPRRDRDRERDALPSFEQQLQEGFRPVYHGGRVVAMVREGETVRPGRRSEGKAKGKGRGRGEGDGGEGGKGWRRPGEDSGSDGRLRWRAQSGQEAIVRATKYMESEQVGSIAPGAIVMQTGDEEVMQHGIVRMPVEYYSEAADVIIRGWVTRTAEAANGPVFFRPAGGKGPGGRGKGACKGKGRPYESELPLEDRL